MSTAEWIAVSAILMASAELFALGRLWQKTKTELDRKTDCRLPTLYCTAQNDRGIKFEFSVSKKDIIEFVRANQMSIEWNGHPNPKEVG